MKNSKKELYNLSSGLVDVFIEEVFSKNEVDLEKAKANISEEQRESLKSSVNRLQEQVEKFLYEENTKKVVTEKESDVEEVNQESPLRELFLKNKKNDENN